MNKKKGQLIVEYVVMFTVIVAVIIFASTRFVRPAMNRFYGNATRVIDNVSQAIDDMYD